MKRIFTIIVLTTIFASLTSPVYAGRKQEVLGVATPASEVNFPPVTSGPGLFLPDGLLFPLDQTFQSIRLALQPDPIARARTHASIAGERMAELRIMFERNDEDGIDTTLRLLTKEMNQAALKLSEAKANGADNETVQQLAGELNEQLKGQREILAMLEGQTQSSMQMRIATARQQLREAKLEVEDSLPEGALQREIEAGMQEDIQKNSQDAQENVTQLRQDLQLLNEELEASRIRNLEARQVALEQAIDRREQQLRDQGEEVDVTEEIETQQDDIQEAIESTNDVQAQLDAIRQVVEEAQRLGNETRTYSQ